MIQNLEINANQIKKMSAKEKDFRIKNLEFFKAVGFPNKRSEDWKFSDFKEIISTNFDKLDIEKLVSFLPTIDVKFQYCAKKNRSETYLNGVNVEDKIRGLEVSENVSKIAKIKEVREKLVKLQQKIGEKKNLVMDGRDIGTKVFP